MIPCVNLFGYLQCSQYNFILNSAKVKFISSSIRKGTCLMVVGPNHSFGFDVEETAACLCT